MIDLILIALLLISLAKPEVLLSKKIKEKANDEQKLILAKNLRKIYALIILVVETSALTRYLESDYSMILILALIVEILFLIKFAIPAYKENRTILKELQ